MILSVYSNQPNSGKKTIAMTFAVEAAKQGLKVLLMDLDYLNSSFALTYGITHSTKNTENFLENATKYGDFKIDNYIIKPSETETKIQVLKKNMNQYPSTLDFLVYSEGFTPDLLQTSLINSWNENQCYEFMARFNAELKSTDYDLIVQVLSNGLDDVFALPIILTSDKCVNMVKYSIKQIELARKIITAFDSNTSQKFIHVLNDTSKKVEKKDYDNLCAPLKIAAVIPFDDNRCLNELNGVVGSPTINSTAINLLNECGLEVTTKKRHFLSKT
ncbi:hypothetical protein ACMGD3_24170 [Lysinibacillus sphaericus]|uniref:nucleotide-binding protein n=1 Tax=Lysinibacillus sphaericus TaxID=1421 RepID=UPI003F79C4ED